MTYRKKLIEVALPLDAINTASVREKSIRHGHPSTLHLWWSRKPLATCRAVLFASLVDDPSEHPDIFPTEKEQETERERLFSLIGKLVQWENSNDEKLLGEVRAEILKSIGGNPPPFLDPFAGGGSIPLEAQRLGLEAHASDLNPVAVLINKALIEIPPKFAGQPPVNPEARKSLVDGDWHGARGLADDIRYYGKWMRDEAERRVGHLYPKVPLPKEYGGGEAAVIAWLWVRTVTCPNPACGAQMPLTSKWWLSKKKGKEVWVEPKTNSEKVISYSIHHGLPDHTQKQDVELGTSFSNAQGKKTKATFTCIICGVGIAKGDYIDSEANSGRMSCMPIAIVVEGKQSRAYLPVDDQQMKVLSEQAVHYLSHPVIQEKIPMEPARGTFASNAQGRTYGFKVFSSYFTARQLATLITLCLLIDDVKAKIISDTNIAGLSLDEVYADAVVTYLALAIDRLADRSSTMCSWDTGYVKVRNTFARQAISMTWDFAEANPLSESTGNFFGAIDWIAEVLQAPCDIQGKVVQRDATMLVNEIRQPLISTDPPYYDNVSYADLSDFFYVWLRRALKSIYPELFSTMLVPKTQELVATPYRFNGSKGEAQKFFETGLQRAFEQMRAIQSPDYPLTIYYAFKQAESEIETNGEEGSSKNGFKVTASTGWETMLEGLISSSFAITGTWPIRTEMTNRSVGLETNALASSIVLVCRPRPADAPFASRRQFLNDLKAELPQALKQMQHGSIAPVDLAQASIGPGMAIYSRYSKVIEADGTPIRVRTALQLINRVLDDVLAEQEGKSDVETRWAIAWFETYAMDEGPYGQGETLSKAKNTAIQTLVDAGILEAKAGKVRLLRPEEYSEKWQSHVTAWEVMQRAIHALDKHGEVAAGNVLGKAGDLAQVVRDLAYRLYTICERKGWSQEAQAYNMLVTSWSGIRDQLHTLARTPQQATLAFEG
jgi:putative DNA methylase